MDRVVAAHMARRAQEAGAGAYVGWLAGWLAGCVLSARLCTPTWSVTTTHEPHVHVFRIHIQEGRAAVVTRRRWRGAGTC